MAPRQHARPADGGQLEDEPEPPGGRRPGPEARLDARRQEARLRQGRGRRACRRSPTSAACRRWSTATGWRSGTAPRTSPRRTTGAYTGEISAGDAGQARLLLRRGRALRAARAPRRVRRDRQRQGPQGGRGRDDPDRLRRRGARRPQGGPPRRAHARAGRRLAGRLRRRAGRPAWWSPTSRCGRSAPARWPRPTTRRRSAPRSAPGSPRRWADEAADAVRILYGGSVKAANVAGIMEKPDVDGCLVGGASLQADEFGGICRFYDMPVI